MSKAVRQSGGSGGIVGHFMQPKALVAVQEILGMDQDLFFIEQNDAVLRLLMTAMDAAFIPMQVKRHLMIGAPQGGIRHASEGSANRPMDVAEKDLSDAMFKTLNRTEKRCRLQERKCIHTSNANWKEGVVHEQQHRFARFGQACAQPVGPGLAIDAPMYARFVGIEKQGKVGPKSRTY